MTTTQTMLTAKGADYVTNWPDVIAKQLGMSVEYMADALTTVLGNDVGIGQFDFYAAEGSGYRHALEVVGNLTPDQAKAVVGEMKAIKARNAAGARANCWDCGLPLGGAHHGGRLNCDTDQ